MNPLRNPFRTPLDPPPKARRPPIRPAPRRPALTIAQILTWADAFHARLGRWPTRTDGSRALPDTTWGAVDACLKSGLRGLNPGSSLARLLMAHRGRRHKGCLSRLTPTRILAWADAHRTRTGAWPGLNSGPVVGAPGETWGAVESALVAGGRGLPGGSSLARLLADRRGVRNPKALPPLRTGTILRWADAHRTRTGDWPTAESGAVAGAPGETWKAVDAALRTGGRGLPGDSSLARLLLRSRGRRHWHRPPDLTVRQILEWVDAHHARTGAWPSGHRVEPIPRAPEGLTWVAVNQALRRGTRGLPGRTTLAALLERHRGVRNRKALPALRERQILAWADDHHRRTGTWPNHRSGPVTAAAGETWLAVWAALSHGRRGLPGGDSLTKLLARRRGVRNSRTGSK